MSRSEKIAVLHQHALEAARRFHHAEAELLEALQKIDADRAYLDFGHPSLFSYAVNELKLTESTAFNFIQVSRKAAEIPALQKEIAAGNLSVSKARKIVPVLNLQNQHVWIERAKTLTSRMLEKEVAKVSPHAPPPESVRYLAGAKATISFNLDEDSLTKLRRVQDLVSQKRFRAASFEDSINTACDFYLEKNDPLEKARRLTVKAGSEQSAVPGQVREKIMRMRPRRAIPADVARQVLLRDGSRCTFRDSRGFRCTQRRWLQVHHRIPLSQGGQDTIDNLATLCFGHHRKHHQANLA